MPIKARNVPLSSPFLVSFFLSLSSLVLVHISIFMVMFIFVAFICVLPCILTLYSCSVADGCWCVCVGFVFFLNLRQAPSPFLSSVLLVLRYRFDYVCSFSTIERRHSLFTFIFTSYYLYDFQFS
jgi:hypothetical protein